MSVYTFFLAVLQVGLAERIINLNAYNFINIARSIAKLRYIKKSSRQIFLCRDTMVRRRCPKRQSGERGSARLPRQPCDSAALKAPTIAGTYISHEVIYMLLFGEDGYQHLQPRLVTDMPDGKASWPNAVGLPCCCGWCRVCWVGVGKQ